MKDSHLVFCTQLRIAILNAGNLTVNFICCPSHIWRPQAMHKHQRGVVRGVRQSIEKRLVSSYTPIHAHNKGCFFFLIHYPLQLIPFLPLPRINVASIHSQELCCLMIKPAASWEAMCVCEWDLDRRIWNKWAQHLNNNHTNCCRKMPKMKYAWNVKNLDIENSMGSKNSFFIQRISY